MHKISVLSTSACSKPLWEICISVLSPLSACSKFKHAYGGRMCPRVHLSGESSSVFHHLYHCLLGDSPLFISMLCFSSHHSILPLPLTIPNPLLMHLSCLPPTCQQILILSPHTERRTTEGNMHEWTHKCRCALANNQACAYINVQTHAHRQYKDISAHMQQHWEWQSAPLLHSNTLRIWRATLPISGTLLHAVDFWRGKHTVMSTGYQPMPQLPTPPPASQPFTAHLSAVCLIERWHLCVRLERSTWHPRNSCNWKIRSLPFGGGRSKMETEASRSKWGPSNSHEVSDRQN